MLLKKEMATKNGLSSASVLEVLMGSCAIVRTYNTLSVVDTVLLLSGLFCKVRRVVMRP